MQRDDVLALLIATVREIIPDLADRPVAGTDSMAELGLDSIERSEVLLMTLEALGLTVPLVQLHGPRDLGELADLLHGKL